MMLLARDSTAGAQCQHFIARGVDADRAIRRILPVITVSLNLIHVAAAGRGCGRRLSIRDVHVEVAVGCIVVLSGKQRSEELRTPSGNATACAPYVAAVRI